MGYNSKIKDLSSSLKLLYLIHSGFIIGSTFADTILPLKPNINKDIINRRLETGITYAEFSYTLIQGYDFLHLYEKYNCVMQAEGSDQWCNITTGIDLIRKKTGKEAYGFTMPLVLDAQGNKFGKSEGNALWLDINKTSSYELYKYLINTDDSMCESYLKIFTFCMGFCIYITFIIYYLFYDYILY